ncbi:hypothetical protein HGB47_20695 [Leptospira yasudae]|uniref:tetratricopeptide repeat protein n=1 Tax=Leptospira yasudae TaxID=2202201 RepID=UPI001C4ED309|nr:hypothetical protein [Leptospira yasudae]MBW0436029.1 hypothetical protein [Leptospira yasudae]
MNKILLIFFLILLFTCKKDESNKYLNDKYALTKSERKEDMQKAREFERTGLAFYKKEENASAISEYEKALEVYANGSLYYNYGNSLWNMGELDSAIRAYKIAELLNYERKDLLYYNLACAYSLKEIEEEAFFYLDKAVNNGYKNFHHILTDKDLQFLRAGSIGWQHRKYLIEAGKKFFLNEIKNLKNPISLQIGTDGVTLCPDGRFREDSAAGIGEVVLGNWRYDSNSDKVIIHIHSKSCIKPEDSNIDPQGNICKPGYKICKDGSSEFECEAIDSEYELKWEDYIDRGGPPSKYTSCN